MASPNPPCLMLISFLRSFSIAIIALSLAISCEAKHFETLSQNQNSYHDHHTLNTPTLDDFVLPNYDPLMQDSINAVSKSFEDFGENGVLSRVMKTTNGNLQSATASCRELLSLASYTLNTSRADPTRKTLDTFKIDLCSTLTYMDTCLDEFANAPEKARNIVISSLNSSKEKVMNIVSMLPTVDDEHDHLNLGSINGSGSAWPPSWMSSKERTLFHMKKRTRIDVIVAKDGSGRFKKIHEAIKFAPKYSTKRFVIYVKQGIYKEYVDIDESKWNIMIFGDGMYKTVVSGHHCDRDTQHYSIMNGSTFAVRGRGFIAIDMGFENKAGRPGGRGVAFLSASDQSVYYRCSMSGYQDTLYAYSGRQFYRECVISGLVDFICGGASAVFQKSTILVRNLGNLGYITAHSRSCPQCPGAYVFLNCWVKAAENLGGAKIFLGRPWYNYSMVVFMQSFLDGLIDPIGWTGWNSWKDPLPTTVYYGEYQNWGPGSGTSRRANIVKRSMLNSQARGFTVRKFIGGDKWLPATGVPYQPNL